MKPVLASLAFLLVLSSTTQALPLLNTHENDFLAEDLEELYDLLVMLKTERLLENLEKEAEMHSLLSAIGMNDEITEQEREEEEEREIKQLNALGRMVREENDEENLARKRRVAALKRLMEGNITFPNIDEEALQEFIEQFHKTPPSKPKEVRSTMSIL
ncbi:unnamed protein product [Hymenolepis diminuta]|uniref:Uncharacterized protein n=1 Tax=Hymenolepis diminuta TaxID=6216 RepID=A0A0R3SUZ4_HYMDI|nr:unnamed protein product [Hymenolepis diminuta]